MPENWEKRQQFMAQLEPPPGFEHTRQYPDSEHANTTSVFRRLRYESYVGAEGRFDATRFIEAFRKATRALVAMEKDIDQILGRLG